MKRGDRVKVLGYGGRVAILRVWQVRARGALLCSESGYRRAVDGGELVAVGFPEADIREVVQSEEDQAGVSKG
jgi:hypothetical protein